MSNHLRYTCGAVAVFALLLSAPAYSQSDDDSTTSTVTVEQCTDEWEDAPAYTPCSYSGTAATIEVTSDNECSITASCKGIPNFFATMTATEALDDVSDLHFCYTPSSVSATLSTAECSSDPRNNPGPGPGGVPATGGIPGSGSDERVPESGGG